MLRKTGKRGILAAESFLKGHYTECCGTLQKGFPKKNGSGILKAGSEQPSLQSETGFTASKSLTISR